MGVTYMNRNQLPLLKTEPFHVVFRSKITVSAGTYDWILTNSNVAANPRADLEPTSLYGIEYFTFSADIDESDYTSAIVDNAALAGNAADIPRFHLYVDGEGAGPILTQPIPLPQFYQTAPFWKWRTYSKEATEGDTNVILFQGMKSTNQFRGAFEARLQQSANLLGKNNISLVLALGILEIKEENFIKEYRAATERQW